MSNTALRFQPGNGQINADGTDLAFLDLDVKGRIISRNAKASQFLKLHPQFVRNHQTECFCARPAHSFANALRAACNRTHPTPTVFLPMEDATASNIQINVLPFGTNTARVVLFWEPLLYGEKIKAIDPKLSVKERSVLNRLAAGQRRDRIAYELDLSIPTIDLHSRNLRRKLNARTTAEAIANAINMQILEV